MAHVLIHVCCAHCLAKTLAGFRRQLDQSTRYSAFWYNPNIHPLIEYRRRLKAVKMYVERDPIPLVLEDEYGLELFCETVHGYYAAPHRCARCYRLRLGRTARQAQSLQCDIFTSTLITSRHQDHALIRQAAAQAQAEFQTPFIYEDFREMEAAPALMQGLYHQQYCGCVFSERDRYINTTKHLYPVE